MVKLRLEIKKKKKKEMIQTNCLLCFNAKSFINGLVHVNIKRSVFCSFHYNSFWGGGLIFKGDSF